MSQKVYLSINCRGLRANQTSCEGFRFVSMIATITIASMNPEVFVIVAALARIWRGGDSAYFERRRRHVFEATDAVAHIRSDGGGVYLKRLRWLVRDAAALP